MSGSPEFSYEKFKDARNGKDTAPFATQEMKDLIEKLKLKNNIFKEVDEKRLDQLKEAFSDQWEALQQDELYQDLDPDQKLQVEQKLGSEDFEVFMKNRFPFRNKKEEAN